MSRLSKKREKGSEDRIGNDKKKRRKKKIKGKDTKNKGNRKCRATHLAAFLSMKTEVPKREET